MLIKSIVFMESIVDYEFVSASLTGILVRVR